MSTFELDATFQKRRRSDGGGRHTLADLLDVPSSPEVEAASPPPAEAVAEPGEPQVPSMPPAMPVDLLFSERELAATAAVAAADARGHAVLEERDRAAARLAEAVDSIASSLAREVACRAAAHRHDAELILAVAKTIVRHVIPKALAAAPLDDLLATLPELLHRLDGTPRVEIAVAPAFEVELRDAVAAGDGRVDFDGDVVVVADAGLEPGAATVRWSDGEARHDPQQLLEQASSLCAGWLAERDALVATTPEEALDER